MKMYISSLVPTDLTAKILMVYSAMYACIAVHETDAAKRLLEVGIVPRNGAGFIIAGYEY